jgi:hypothetical protein
LNKAQPPQFFERLPFRVVQFMREIEFDHRAPPAPIR